jgi:deoxyribose-phosphate aldolase
MVEARAAAFTRRSIKTASKLHALRLALSMLDLTTLEGKDTPEKVRALCRKAVNPSDQSPVREHGPSGAARESAPLPAAPVPHAAAVCVYPTFVKLARETLDACGEGGGRTVKVASVATGFPSGQFPLSVRIADVRAAVEDGADEIDMVINRGAFLAGRYDEVAAEIREVMRACVRGGGTSAGTGGGARALLKVILETGELETLDNVRRASDLAIHAMADAVGNNGDVAGGFIKTSTGKVQPAATLPVTLVMLEAIRDHYLATGCMVGMKPAGGISTAKLALHYLVMVNETLGPLPASHRGRAFPGGPAWLTPQWFRFGASSLTNDLLRQVHKLASGAYAARYDFSEA